MKLCIVVATPFTARAFLLDQIAQLARRYDVTVVANGADAAIAGVNARCAQAPIERRISLVADVRALWALYRLFRRERFDAVHSVTPKAGLLAMVAAFLARVPVRVHVFTGQVWATRTGLARMALKSLDRITAASATHVLVDSPSQCAFLRAEGVLAHDRGEVLARGSISGVDTRRFRPDPTVRAAVHAELGIPADAVVFLFVGRLIADKGVLDLAQAFAAVAKGDDRAWLLLVGPDESGLARTIERTTGTAADRVRTVGMTDAPERYAAAADVFVLPSYREGFGSVVIEAAAAGLPAIGTRIYGVLDAIEDGVTGYLVPPREPSRLADAMARLAREAAERHRLGAAARARVLEHFTQEKLTSALLAFYARVLPQGAENPREDARRSFD